MPIFCLLVFFSFEDFLEYPLKLCPMHVRLNSKNYNQKFVDNMLTLSGIIIIIINIVSLYKATIEVT